MLALSMIFSGYIGDNRCCLMLERNAHQHITDNNPDICEMGGKYLITVTTRECRLWPPAECA